MGRSEQQQGVAHPTFALAVELLVVARTVDDTVLGLSLDVHRGRTASVEVQGVFRSEPFEDVGQFVQVYSQ